MSNDAFALALSNPSMLALLIENKAQLDRPTRRKVEKYVNQLLEATERHDAAQDALSQVDIYTLYKANQTMEAEDFIRKLRASSENRAEQEAHSLVLRKLYLESSYTAAAKVAQKILDSLD